jgi:SNF2 family DNA or RNA helicase
MIVHPKSRSLLLRVKNPHLLMECIPNHKIIDIEGHNLAVRHGIDEVKVLRNLGINAPSPVLYYYNWPGKWKPLAHQKDTVQMLTLNRRAFVLNETGTMKTACALWAADYLMSIGKVRKVLVASTLSSLERTWLEEVFNVLMHRSAVILHADREKRLERLKSDVDFYIINHDGLRIVRQALSDRDDIDLIIVDEASEYRNSTTEKWKTLNAIATPQRRLWLMTATPCPNAPTDAYALAKLVDPSRVPKYFNGFRMQTMLQVTQYKWAPKPEAYRIAFDAMQPAVRYRKEDCLDLPPIVTEERQCELSPEQIKAYDTMRAQFIVEAAGSTISAVNAADKIMKLRQILCGAIRDPITGDYVELPHEPRLKVLLECIGLATAKAIVVVPFKGIITALEREVSPHYSCAVLNGDVSPSKRNTIIKNFKNTPDPHVLLCHPQVIAHSLNLTEADMTIFYGPIYSNDQMMQVIERFNRPGQTRKMTVIRIGATKLEWEIYSMLDSKRDSQESILELYSRVIRKEI